MLFAKKGVRRRIGSKKSSVRQFHIVELTIADSGQDGSLMLSANNGVCRRMKVKKIE